MNKAADLQTVMQEFLPTYRQSHPLSPRQAQVCAHLGACRTEALGGLQWHCDHCEYEQAHYLACRDRHCPKCQWRATTDWCEKQTESVLPVTYYHVVFTLPHTLNPWVACHPEVMYRLLFQTVWSTLKAFGADPKRLGGELGMTAVLHTWGQQLWRHVHLHCLIPGGALGEEGQWHASRSTYLFPDRALARRFRGCMVSRLRAAYASGALHRISDPGEIDTCLDRLMQTDWVVYTKPWLTHPETVVDYLARYSHRIAISDSRILGIEDGEVEVSYKDYRDGNRWKVMSLKGEELIRRYLLHVLPKGLMRIRHFGFLANRCRKAKLARIRHLLAQEPEAVAVDEKRTEPGATLNWLCPKCHQGHLHIRQAFPPIRLHGG